MIRFADAPTDTKIVKTYENWSRTLFHYSEDVRGVVGKVAVAEDDLTVEVGDLATRRQIHWSCCY